METLLQNPATSGVEIFRWAVLTLLIIWWGLFYLHKIETMNRRTVGDVPIIAISGLLIMSIHAVVTAALFFPQLFGL